MVPEPRRRAVYFSFITELMFFWKHACSNQMQRKLVLKGAGGGGLQRGGLSCAKVWLGGPSRNSGLTQMAVPQPGAITNAYYKQSVVPTSHLKMLLLPCAAMR
jgi:hypothetical protein